MTEDISNVVKLGTTIIIIAVIIEIGLLTFTGAKKILGGDDASQAGGVVEVVNTVEETEAVNVAVDTLEKDVTSDNNILYAALAFIVIFPVTVSAIVKKNKKKNIETETSKEEELDSEDTVKK